MTKEQERKILRDIASKDTAARNAALELVFKHCFPDVEAYVFKNSGTKADAKDVFQDGVTILYQNIVHNKFRKDASVTTYLYSICRNLWLQQLRLRPMQIVGSVNDSDLEPDEAPEEQVNIQRLKKVMGELKNDCMGILLGFYYEMRSMKELADIFKLGSEQAAKNKKSRCLKYLTKIMNDKGLTYERFLR